MIPEMRRFYTITLTSKKPLKAACLLLAFRNCVTQKEITRKATFHGAGELFPETK